MTRNRPRFAFIASTAGGVMNEVLKSEFVKSVVHAVITDGQCEAVDVARRYGLPFHVLDEAGANEAFCKRALAQLTELKIDYVLSFYTQFYSDAFREVFADRIVNLHPSLLPAFKGMDGFGDGFAYGTRFLGTTVEFIKDVMDEGKIVMQTSLPVDPSFTPELMRHQIFEQQCKTLLQVVRWLSEDRIRVSGDRVHIRDATFEDSRFSPALDWDEARNWAVPLPASLRGVWPSTSASGATRNEGNAA